MIKDRIALDLPDYNQLLCGYYQRGSEYRSWRQNGTDDWLLIATLSGSGYFGSQSASRLVAGPGRVILIRPGATHDYGTEANAKSWELLWVHFHPRPHWHEWLTWPEHAPGLMYLDLNPEEHSEAVEVFWRVYTQASSTAPHGLNFAMNALEELVLRCHGSYLQMQRTLDSRIKSVLDFIDSHLHDRVNIDDLADMAALSPSRFSHLFRQQTGIAPMQHVDMRRIERSKQLLERTAYSIGHVAEQVGFEPINFALRFKQHTGVSPRDYRKMVLGVRQDQLRREKSG